MKGQTQMQSLHIIYDTIMECLFLKHNKETLLPKHSWEILLLTGRGSRQSVCVRACARVHACVCVRAWACVCARVGVGGVIENWNKYGEVLTSFKLGEWDHDGLLHYFPDAGNIFYLKIEKIKLRKAPCTM